MALCKGAEESIMLEEFYVMFKEDGFQFMTKGVEYLVTFNGAHHGSYRGHDDNGTAFCYAIDVFYPRAPASVVAATAPQARHADDLHRISPPSGDYTHMGRWQGPDSIEMTNGREYNLIYNSMSNTVAFMSDLSNWLSAEGNMFDVTHDYACPHAYPNQDPAAHTQAKRAAKVRAGRNTHGQHDDDCDMTGISITDCSDFEQDMPVLDAQGIPADWTEDGDPVIAPGPESTEDLRQYRFKPDLF